ncbi:esterase/lipase family protein [Streptomyces sp. URMC 123]|uniref:esterase/lipase family protein n=1 Tax=Streptomyces sp. URMC 123 TaxID=3423403 RepID=UPI003F1A68E2
MRNIISGASAAVLAAGGIAAAANDPSSGERPVGLISKAAPAAGGAAQGNGVFTAAPDMAKGAHKKPVPATPVKTNSKDKPVYLIKGLDPWPSPTPGVSCRNYWGPLLDALGNEGWATNNGDRRMVGFYAGDHIDCDTRIAEGDQNTAITTLGLKLARHIHDNYSKKGQSVDIVAHSMGGLIARSALTGVQRGLPGYPKYLFVEDVVTISTPHAGSDSATWCAGTVLYSVRQCRQMKPGSGFMRWLGNSAPQGQGGTDWTLIGGYDDAQVSPRSSVDGMHGVKHRVRYESGQGLGHSTINITLKGTYRQQYDNGSGWKTVRNGAAPARAAMNALYWSRAW